MTHTVPTGAKTYRAIVGLGKTGLSCARYLKEHGHEFVAMDSRSSEALKIQLHQISPNTQVQLGGWNAQWLEDAEEVLVSPGVDPATLPPSVQHKIAGDIELFARENTAPVIAVTGSNGKSTVVDLLGHLLRAAGKDVAVGGNIGTPALELLQQRHELIVLELSSFQLQTTHSLKAAAAVVLNVCDDHLDRHKTLSAYAAIKRRIYHGCAGVVYNLDDPHSQPERIPEDAYRFTLTQSNDSSGKTFQLLEEQDAVWLSDGVTRFVAVDELHLKGRHNAANALAALALLRAAGVEINSAVLDALRSYAGLPHRCQLVGRINGVDYINDSKATNVGSTLAALQGFAAEKAGRIWLLAGGDSKQADLSALKKAFAETLAGLLVFGRDADRIAALCDSSHVYRCDDLHQAVSKANALAQPGDLVLLSPACASFDMFDNYEHRGRVFTQAVEGLS